MFEKLEKAVLKFRTNEMMLILFHIEDLKKFLIGSLKASNLLLDENDEDFFHQDEKVMPQVWSRVIKQNILSETEVSDLKKIINIRNDIAHEIQKFTYDLHSELNEYGKKTHLECKYNYEALDSLRGYKDRLCSEWQKDGIISLSLRASDFKFAEKVYLEENLRLSKHIDKLSKQRLKVINSVNEELSGINFTTYEEYPQNKANYREDGVLTRRGVKTCRELLSKNLSCEAVSILMDISLRKVKYHNRSLAKGT